ncbi:hypothetical protein POM88_038155 [Heracleum sosnowskyi]|uniref:F-box domain-containing protein n=1 Tax=Heracleum sosnowskyi TaxID=360622 RepID=A0AAD8MHF0_9APIA|nr:hypothetical protein POM88_038155 [Heracleum sosnowskyi]
METLTGYHIPDDKIIDIMSWLPAKSLGRFKTVSKSWLSIISNPSFRRFSPSSCHYEFSEKRITYDPQNHVDDGIEGPWILKYSFVVAPTVDLVHGYLNSSRGILFRNESGEWWLYNPDEKKTKNAPVRVGTRKILKHTET